MKNYDWVNYYGSSYFPMINLYFFEVDSRVVIFILPLGLITEIWMLYLSLFFMLLFILLGFLGYPVPIAIKRSLKFYAGDKRSVSTNKQRKRRFNNG
ncbi:MAG: hypothetical protein ACJAS1_007178 [Oleiphilaceae bacterium]|jgi:hypothetical protein